MNSGRLRGLFHVKRRLPGCPPDRAGVSRETPPSAWHRSRRYREGCERLPEPDCGPRERSTRAVGDTRPPSWGPTAPNGPHRAPVLRGRRPGHRRRGCHGLPGSAQLWRSTGRVPRTAPRKRLFPRCFPQPSEHPRGVGETSETPVTPYIARILPEPCPKTIVLGRTTDQRLSTPLSPCPRVPVRPGNKAAGKGCAGPAVA